MCFFFDSANCVSPTLQCSSSSSSVVNISKAITKSDPRALYTRNGTCTGWTVRSALLQPPPVDTLLEAVFHPQHPRHTRKSRHAASRRTEETCVCGCCKMQTQRMSEAARILEAQSGSAAEDRRRQISLGAEWQPQIACPLCKGTGFDR